MATAKRRTIRRKRSIELSDLEAELPDIDLTGLPNPTAEELHDLGVTPTPRKKRAERVKPVQPVEEFIPGFPLEGRPWPLKQGEGVKVVSEKATTDHGDHMVMLYLDAGSFRWLWELVELKAHDNYRRFNGVKNVQELSDVGLRTLTAVREVGHQQWPTKYGTPSKKKKVVIRRK